MVVTRNATWASAPADRQATATHGTHQQERGGSDESHDPWVHRPHAVAVGAVLAELVTQEDGAGNHGREAPNGAVLHLQEACETHRAPPGMAGTPMSPGVPQPGAREGPTHLPPLRGWDWKRGAFPRLRHQPTGRTCEDHPGSRNTQRQTTVTAAPSAAAARHPRTR